ncbi:MAG: thiamine pyrophosphate-binding protein [Alphaproteobacteria bacterium]|nr:thiamine pyrophosphate-binding protein [Alphaproteobacteria bacterium]
MIKVTDYIAKRLKEHGVEHFFMVSGGGAMHLNDSLGRAIPYTANHHEQACAIAAEGYARVNQKLAVVNVTTGPGGLNALNGVMGQWTDSVPVLYLSGQVKYSTTMDSCSDIPLRQLGDQEVDIISVVKPLAKYAVMVKDAKDIKYHLDKAIYEATHGRMGPVWLDVPMNIQGAMIDEKDLREFTPNADVHDCDLKIDTVISKLEQAKRPLIVAGHGIRLSNQIDNFNKLINTMNIPVVTTFNGFDLMDTAHPLFAGRIGTVGQRAGNFVLQNADTILFLGTRNNIRQVSYNWENFASDATKIVVDIDSAELNKPTVRPDIAVNANLQDFIPALLNKSHSLYSADWAKYCQDMKQKYSFANSVEYQQKPNEAINVYNFVHELTSLMPNDAIMVAANGSACVCAHQVGIVKSGQRQFWNSGDASMGYDLPAAIGASYQANGRPVICLAGDGSIMMNLQELETISYNKLPIKIFVINNNGYSSIRQTQRNFFEGRMTGAGTDSGVGIPKFSKIASAFDIPSIQITQSSELTSGIKKALSTKGPVLTEVMTLQEYAFLPKLSARKLPDGSMVSPSLEDMFPFVDRTEYAQNMIKNRQR